MAACGKNVTDEVKDDEEYDEKNQDWSDDDIDPDNIVEFPTKNIGMNCAKTESFLTKDDDGNEKDRRIQVFFYKNEFHTESYFMLCQILVQLKAGKFANGSATCVPFAKHPYFLTCAHNLVRWSPLTSSLVPYEGLKYYRARHGKKSYMVSGKVNKRKMLPHPKYDGCPESGFDIGIFRLGKIKQGKFSENTHGSTNRISHDVMMHYFDENLEKGMVIEIAGYPGDKLHYPHKHTGKITEIKKTGLGGYLIWYDADTVVSNSGSSIVVTDENYVKSVTKNPEIKKIIIGVHSGYDDVESLNFGTLITEGLYDWITTR